MRVEDRFVTAQIAFKTIDRTGKNNRRLKIELFVEFALPLFRQIRRAKNTESVDFAAVDELAKDQTRFDRLTDPDVVRDEKARRLLAKRKEKRNELIRTRLNVNPPERAEGPRCVANIQTKRVPKKGARRAVPRKLWIRTLEDRGLDLVESRKETRRLLLAPVDRFRKNHLRVFVARRLNHPFSSADRY